MRISDFGGENALIKLIGERYGVEPSGDLVLGIGDDAALIRTGDKLLIVTTDLLVENTHFRMDINEPYLLGWKAVAVNISDVAAMGGVPTYTFVSIGLPNIDVPVVEGIYEGMRDCCAKYGSVIAGGDTVGSAAGIVINVTQLGWVEPDKAALRSGARSGDQIIVTNTLGDSRAGLEVLLKYGVSPSPHPSTQLRMPSPIKGEGDWRFSPVKDKDDWRQFLVERHLKPHPRINEARAAVATGKVHAMMDLSDGLSMDLTRMCEASGVGARVYYDQVPMSDELRAAAEKLDKDPLELAVSGGEDYELLITCYPKDCGDVCKAIESAGSAAWVIGEMNDGSAPVLIMGGEEHPMPGAWQHF